MGVASLLGAAAESRVLPIVAVGEAFIDLTPSWLREFAIRTFGSSDKLALIVGIVVVLGLAAATTGVLARRRLSFGLAGVAVLGGTGAAATIARPEAPVVDVVSLLMGAILGALALMLLTRAAEGDDAQAGAGSTPDPASPGQRTRAPTVPGPARSIVDRRRFLAAGTGVAALVVTSGLAGRLFTGIRAHVAASRAAIRLPEPASAAAPVPARADLGVPHVPPFFTPNGGFYRVDTRLTVPQITTDDWRLRVHGMVEREIVLTFDDLLRRPLIERDITLACVSNEVGGPLVGNARWLGAPLADLLREAGVKPGANEILSRAAEGWTCGTPTAVVMDGREAMLAVAMNGKPLPLAHGFPVRMVVPGLYGFVSATKWVVDLTLTRFEDARPYWARRGWALRAPVKTMSRIDNPRPGTALPVGRVAVAGVVWAQHRGIKRVEVRVDNGQWHEARLAPVPSVDTWRQWVHIWDATPGGHQLQVRATDGTGRTQPEKRTPKYPDGATGWHSIDVTVM